MLYLYHGSNTKKVADQTNKLIAGLLAKRPLAHVFSFEGETLQEEDLDALIEARGLFVEKHIVVLRQVLGSVESREIVLARLARFAETQNIIVLSEHVLTADQKKVLTKHAVKIEEYKKTEKEKEQFNVFSLSDALGTRNKQELWVLYMQALQNGVEPESIQGTLHWTVRSMLVSVSAKSAEESGQKPFVYSKFKRFASHYKKEEIVSLSRSLISLYHDAHRGAGDLRMGLERWILSL